VTYSKVSSTSDSGNEKKNGSEKEGKDDRQPQFSLTDYMSRVPGSASLMQPQNLARQM
jgi:hypothetical protein